MQARLGPQLYPTCAGENIVIDAEPAFSHVDLAVLAAGLELATADGGRARLHRFVVAAPCVEFSHYALALEEAPRFRAAHKRLLEIVSEIDQRSGKERGTRESSPAKAPPTEVKRDK